MRRITGCTTLGGGGRSNAEGEERRLKVKEGGEGRRERRRGKRRARRVGEEGGEGEKT